MVLKPHKSYLRKREEQWKAGHSPYSHEQLKPKDIQELLLHIGELVPGTGMELSAKEAVEHLRNKKLIAAKMALEGAVGKRE